MALMKAVVKITDSQEALVSLELSSEQIAGGLIAPVMDRVPSCRNTFFVHSPLALYDSILKALILFSIYYCVRFVAIITVSQTL